MLHLKAGRWIATTTLLLITSDVPGRVQGLGPEHVSSINAAFKSVPNITPDLCPQECTDPETGAPITNNCPHYNPCEGHSCVFNKKAICFFCCCGGAVRWTDDGRGDISCEVVRITRKYGPDNKSNPHIPVPLVQLFDEILPQANGDSGFSPAIMQLKKKLPDKKDEHQVEEHWLDCKEVLKRCRRMPWDDDCDSCLGQEG